MVVQAAAAKAELRRPEQEILEIGISVGCAGEEKLAIEHLGENFVEIDACKFAAKAEYVLAFHPTQGVDEIVIVLRLKLVREGRGANFEAGAGEDEFID